eukprot:2834953-Pyramimonas_sp.AAC.1
MPCNYDDDEWRPTAARRACGLRAALLAPADAEQAGRADVGVAHLARRRAPVVRHSSSSVVVSRA